MADQICDFFYLIGKGVILLGVFALMFFIAKKTKNVFKKEKDVKGGSA
ncbi:MAG: hypothetical protein JW893_05520 [Candidatus Omnitrophica bacterium]|nr:hypothetical protein [Candidatus Omnitrophota bacterium]